MSQKYSRRLVHNIGEEAQLIADEKWIIDALAKIKQQRNSLQIERLHLESLKNQSKLESRKLGNFSSAPSTPQPRIADETVLPSTSAVNLMQNVVTTAPHTEYGTPGMLQDGYCNNEVLDLAVTRDGNNIVNTSIDTEEDDDEYEEDIFIDMNMFMNGKYGSK